ncbi:MAG: DUF1549 domain-containing protein, partial [Pirellula sp.]
MIRCVVSIILICSVGVFAQEEHSKVIGSALQDPSNPIAELFDGERLDLWSLQPIQSPTFELQASQDFDHPIDLFLTNGSPKQDHKIPPQTTKEQLLQRLSLDLIGLRASYEKVTSFQHDQSP